MAPCLHRGGSESRHVSRPASSFPPNTVLHVVNRGVERRDLFASPADYRRFLWLLHNTQQWIPLRLLAYALMPNHWHLVAWPASASELSQFMHRLCGQHAAELRMRTSTVGNGHVYQGRYRAHAIRNRAHYFNVMRYVEANPLRAGLVARAEDWAWSSVQERLRGPLLTTSGPESLPAPESWLAELNRPMTREEVAQARWRR